MATKCSLADLQKSLGHQIQVLRKVKKMSQRGLAEKAGIHFTYVGKIEHGETNMSLETLKGIVDALSVKMSDLFERVEG
ncbi:helix-turn-helix domain-containing protein [Candidatus Gracilibacteria bacterium]|nr:helix-turn-helix domain-containing protein [Candidatus Gracilibacteria bacterium]